jgi:hypothetical protein
MVTHRWWGNKFCKRACKNAHRRQNHHIQSGWVIPRFFTFAGGACLAAAVAVAMLTLLLASANAAPGEERPVAGSRWSSTRRTARSTSIGQDRSWPEWGTICARRWVSQLITVVPHGKLCASMCIPIFLQGEDRLAARASVWIFHEVAQRQANGTIRRKRRKQICSTYYRRATSRLYPNKRRKKADIS